ncbi:DUF4865 family protein [Actinoplanes teichomyceticus]|uniref:Uncharacterized protein DUF4865 n=1 Tax=Actinoplanes teichomyceticus TaxID=1867 RepID=A0A561VCJ4_ACTTI|nr:DUF4865 family protein [Actinoplanes teichomyceticus]TWG09328.1 uncharacterized protein DUF4865 [Actinoplanes teichomyceticus]GIF16648.1 DUF4865 domain-containing protein [Actinoplanes teichomyceticus]
MSEPQLLMQYPITLPADYDMEIIRTRVRTRGGALDDRRGLLCKAYCIRTAGVDGSPVNQYAPFYLWADSGAAADFLWGGQGFDGIVRDFGRPRVRTWVPAAFGVGGCGRAEVTHAMVRTWAIDQDADLRTVADALGARVRDRARHPRTHLAAGGIDPATWQAVEVTTVAGLDDGTVPPDATLFTVLHVSEPDRNSAT